MTQATAETVLLVGDVVGGKYRIDGVAGEGGMGRVYEAEHVILRRRVALKVLLPGALASREALDRFSLEASAVARIASEHVVRVMDAGTLPNGAPYVVMEYLEGADLEQLLARRGPLPPADVVDWVLQALEGLSHAHAAGVIHRDLKCANLFLAEQPDGRRIIKLVDFGLAVAVEEAQRSEPGRVAGSPRYMSPEQLRKEALDPRTDLWSLGVVMHELIAGKPPFDGSLQEIVAGILGHEPAPLGGIPAELASVVTRCLTKDTGARWQTAAELARALAPFASEAWQAAADRVEQVLANARPPREPRRFESLDAALSDLDTRPTSAVTFDASAHVSSPAALDATLPALPPDVVVESTTLPSVTQAPAPDALRILMIDDSEFVLGVHAEVLEEDGFAVKWTTSVDEFERMVDEWRPHLVLMDVRMPETSGEELCRRVKAKHKASVPVVLVSHLDRAQLAERASTAGADAFLSKTGDWTELVAFVRNICALTYSPEHLPGAK